MFLARMFNTEVVHFEGDPRLRREDFLRTTAAHQCVTYVLACGPDFSCDYMADVVLEAVGPDSAAMWSGCSAVLSVADFPVPAVVRGPPFLALRGSFLVAVLHGQAKERFLQERCSFGQWNLAGGKLVGTPHFLSINVPP